MEDNWPEFRHIPPGMLKFSLGEVLTLVKLHKECPKLIQESFNFSVLMKID